mmetsp:Transcript_22157/g.61663  ORF Transcript_22157/g.61663 Transcript_22157/m.61663 type:complete len:251 (+) Transcript_22157:866-1618(+)
MICLQAELEEKEEEGNREANSHSCGTELEQHSKDANVLAPVVVRDTGHPASQLWMVIAESTRFVEQVESVVMGVEAEDEHAWSLGELDRDLDELVVAVLSGALARGASVVVQKELAAAAGQITPASNAELHLLVVPVVEHRAPAASILVALVCFADVDKIIRVHPLGWSADAALVHDALFADWELLVASADGVEEPGCGAAGVVLGVDLVSAAFLLQRVFPVEVVGAMAAGPDLQVGHPQHVRVQLGNVR